jgi:hypothetical protein
MKERPRLGRIGNSNSKENKTTYRSIYVYADSNYRICK